MALICYHASHEQFAPSHLLKLVQLAEQAGFDGIHSSDQAPFEFLLEVLIRSVITYIILLVVIKLLGKRMSGRPAGDSCMG